MVQTETPVHLGLQASFREKLLLARALTAALALNTRAINTTACSVLARHGDSSDSPGLLWIPSAPRVEWANGPRQRISNVQKNLVVASVRN